MRRTDSIDGAAKSQNGYVFVRIDSCGRVRFWTHEGQKEKQIERKREIR